MSPSFEYSGYLVDVSRQHSLQLSQLVFEATADGCGVSGVIWSALRRAAARIVVIGCWWFRGGGGGDVGVTLEKGGVGGDSGLTGRAGGSPRADGGVLGTDSVDSSGNGVGGGSGEFIWVARGAQ